MIRNTKIRKVLSCLLLAVFALGQMSYASDISYSCLAPPLYLKPPCAIVTQADGTYTVTVSDPERSKVEFLWFLTAEALDKGLDAEELKNLISELLEGVEGTEFLETFDIEHIRRDDDSFLLPLRNSGDAFRFFDETNAGRFGGEVANEERLLLFSGNVIRFSLAEGEMPPDVAVADQDEEDLAAASDAVRYLWDNHRELWNNLQALKKVLIDEYGFHLIKTAGKKLLMYSKNKKYILKVNWEDDNGYAKEKLFFFRGLPIPSTKVLFHHDESRTLIFNNVTINNDSILFYDYLRNHLSLEDPESAGNMMKAYGKVLADIHAGPLLAVDDPIRQIFRPQDWEAQIERVEERRKYLRDYGYHIVPPIELFREAQSRIGEDDIVVTHGDPSPWNCYVDVEEGRISSIIDAETSSEESRYKDMAKVVIAIIDASKNSPHMLKNLEGMLTQFFNGYFEYSGIDREKALRALPYYLGTQLLWYTEETQRVFSIPAWVHWRLELCQWSLEREMFDIGDLIGFLSEESHKLVPGNIDNLRVADSKHENAAYSGGELAVTVGEKINIHLEVTFPMGFGRKISGLQVGVELWTDMDQEGAWHGIPAFELKEIYGNRAIFEGQVAPRTPGAYRMTARVVVNSGRPDAWSQNQYGDIRLRVMEPGPVHSADPVWERAINDTYSAVMMDYDGTIMAYDGTIPEEVYDACADMVAKGIHVCVNTSRSTPDSTIEFFNVIRERLGDDFRPEFCHVYYGLGYYNLEAGNVEGFEVTPEVTDSMQTVMKEIEGNWVNEYIDNLQVSEGGSLIGFIFKGDARKDVFARVLNKMLEELNLTLPESVVAVYADNYFQIIPQKMAKNHWLDNFVEKTGIPRDKIVRIGDQGQRYGVDTAMCDSYGGFTVNHDTGAYVYPLSTPKYLGLYGIEGTAWLLQNLKYAPFRGGVDNNGRRPLEAEQVLGNNGLGTENEGSAEGVGISCFAPDPGVWGLGILPFVRAMFEDIKGFLSEEMLKRELVPSPRSRYNMYKPKGLILYADSMVEDMGFLDMGRTLSGGFFKSRKIFEGGAIVLYGSAENCEILRSVIDDADPDINVFTVESIAAPSEIVELELVADRAKRIVRKSSGIEYDFIGLIRGRSDRVVDLVRIAKGIKMPIVLFDNVEGGIYSFSMALTEAFNRRYSGSMDRWVCCLKPITRLSEQAAQDFREYILEQREIATRA